jgi:hypothetical protein
MSMADIFTAAIIPGAETSTRLKVLQEFSAWQSEKRNTWILRPSIFTLQLPLEYLPLVMKHQPRFRKRQSRQF